MKQTKGSKTKQHLFQCALTLFREKGFEQVSVDEIVKAAGTAKGTFYVHFASKAAIITEMLYEYDDYYDNVVAGFTSEQTVEEKIMQMLQASCYFTEQIIGRDLIRILYTQSLKEKEGTAITLNNNRSLYRILFQLIKEAQEIGVIDKDIPAERSTKLIMQAIRSSFFEWCMEVEGYLLYEECQYMVATILKGLKEQIKQPL